MAFRSAADGEAGAEDLLFELVYSELRLMAKSILRRLTPGQTLQATALVHEVWLKIENADKNWDGRAHFFGVVSRAMRNILVDDARRKASAKHGRGRSRLSVESIADSDSASSALEILALDEALEDLGHLDSRSAKVVMLRYFSGLGVAQVAGILEVSERTVERDWRFARSWLKERMLGRGRDASSPSSGVEDERPEE